MTLNEIYTYLITLGVVLAAGYLLLTVTGMLLKRKRKQVQEEIRELEIRNLIKLKELDQMLPYPCIWERPGPIGVRQCCHAEVVEALLQMESVYACVTNRLCRVCPFRQVRPEIAIQKDYYVENETGGKN